jgi:predicted transcriptional regulator
MVDRWEYNQKLLNYVYKRFKGTVSKGDLTLFYCLQSVEKEPCEPVTMKLQDIANIIPFDRKNMSKQLKRLKEHGLIEYEAGEPLKRGGLATRFRRLKIDEIEKGKVIHQLKQEKMNSAVDLSKILQTRNFLWKGEKKKLTPSISRTGRVYTSLSNAEKHDRAENLLCNIGKDEILIEVDYKQAEPTVISKSIDYQFPFSDPYMELAKAENISRDKAKEKLNSLSYIEGSPSKMILQWKDKSKELFSEYADKLEQKRDELWTISKAKPRGTKTLTRHFIKAVKGDEIHKGNIFNWCIQGTVSDILNISCLEVIRKEKNHGWKLLYPLHDSAFIICKKDDPEKIKKIFEDTAKSKNIPLKVEVKEHEKR